MVLDTKATHRIPDNKAFKGYTWGKSSGKWMHTSEAVVFGSKGGRVLESAREHAAFYAASIGTTENTEVRLYHRVRTISLSLKINGKWFTFFDDNPNPKQNIILVRRSNYEYANSSDYLIPMNDPLVELVVDRYARGFARRVRAPVRDHISFSTELVGKSSAFGRDSVIEALLADQAEPYTAACRASGQKEVHRITFSIEDLVRMNVPKDMAVIRPVGLGFYSDFSRYIVNAGLGLGADRMFDNDYCRARGVRGARDFRLEKRVEAQ